MKAARGLKSITRFGPLFFCLLALPARALPPAEIQLYLEAFDFLDTEDPAGVLQLEERILKNEPEEAALVTRVIHRHVQARDREGLMKTFEALVSSLKCNAPVRTFKVCAQYRKLWIGNLDSIVFYESTSGKVEKVRRLIGAQDCAAAIPVLKEVLAKEGPFRPALDLAEEAYRCAKRESEVAAIAAQQERLRIFTSGI